MNCEQMTLLMSTWLDGELSELEEKQMKEHLERCPDCRVLMEQLQSLHTSFSDLEEIPAPEGFADSVMERIARESKPRKVVPLFKRPQLRALTALAACAALFVGFGSIRMGGSAKSESAAPMAPAPESAVYYDPAENEGAMEYAMDSYSKAAEAPMEPMAPAAGEPSFDAAPETPMESAMSSTVCETGPSGESAAGECRIILSRLPEGLEEKLGPLMWEERLEDGALCARLTADEAMLVLEMAEEQGMDGTTVDCTGVDEDNWILVLQTI